MNREDLTLKVNEIFCSLQGEGARAGTLNIFIRLSGCSCKELCNKNIICDTQFEGYQEMKLSEIKERIKAFAPCCSIIWTGGEPCDQLTEEILFYFNEFYHSVETSGIKSIPLFFNYVTISPKIAEHSLEKIQYTFSSIRREGKRTVNELRYVIHDGQALPVPHLKATHYFLSPHIEGDFFNPENLKNVYHCQKLIKDNPLWRLNIPLHKILTIR